MECLARRRTRAQARRRDEYLGRAISGALLATHDYNLANASGAAFRSDANDALSAIVTQNSGTSWGTSFAREVVVDTSAGVKKRRNAANSGWIAFDTDDEAFVLSRSSNTMLDSSDRTKTIVATSGFTQTLDAVATLGDGWWCRYRIESGATIVFDPNSTENIDGATTKTVVGPAEGMLVCNGSALFTIGLTKPAASRVVLSAGTITTTSTSLTDLTGATVTITTGTNPVLVSQAAAGEHSAGDGTLFFNIDVDGSLELGTGGLDWQAYSATADVNCSFSHLVTGLSAGSHTFKIQWKTPSGTASVFASAATKYALSAVEIR